MESESSSKQTQVQPAQAPKPGQKITMTSVVSHEKLMNWIKERNPIIARARTDGPRR